MALAREFRLQVILGKGPYPEELAASAEVRICSGANLKIIGRWIYLTWVLLLVVRSRYCSRPRDSGALLLITTYQPICILVGALAQRLLGVTWVADVFDVPALGLEITRGDSKSSLRRLCSIPRRLLTELAYRSLKRADLVLCTLVPDALTRCAIRAEKIVALTNGVELHHPPLAVVSDGGDREVFEVLYVGAVLRIRGVDTMLDACDLLHGRLPGLRLLLVGPSEAEDSKWVHRRIAELGLQTAVSVTGELPHGEVLRRVSEADLCLFPFPKNYATEFIYPVKVLEYIGAGRTVVASDLPGIRRIIENGYSGLLVEPGSPRALADAMYSLWKSPELRATLAANARVAAARFEWNKINVQMVEALNILAEEHS